MPSQHGQGQPNWSIGVVFNWVKDLALLGLFQKLAVFLTAEQQIWMLCYENVLNRISYENVLDRIIYQVYMRDLKFSLQRFTFFWDMTSRILVAT
jgi:hypothetical protein